MPIVNVKGVANPIQFPDDMDINDIREVLRQKFAQLAVSGDTGILDESPNIAAPYEPSLAEKLGTGIGDALTSSGIVSDNYGAQRIGRNVSALAEFLPGVGDATAGDDAGRAFAKGDIGEGLLHSAGAIPILGDMAIFAGVLAKNADLGALHKAKMLEDTGADRNKIWKDTGWVNDKGDWKFEIDDSLSKPNPYQVEPSEAYSRLVDDAVIAGDINERNSKWNVAEGKFDAGDENALSEFMSDVEGIDSMLGQMRSSYAPVKGYLKHDELYSQYPDVGDIHTRIDSELGARGSYNEQNGLYGEKIELKERPDFNKPKSTLLHESQHAIQQREGFQRGGNPGMSAEVMEEMRSELYQPLNRQQKAIENSREYEALVDKYKSEGLRGHKARNQAYSDLGGDEIEAKQMKAAQLIDSISRGEADSALNPNRVYQRLAGEAEARNVQTRLDWTPEQRRATPPWESLDVPENELIYRK